MTEEDSRELYVEQWMNVSGLETISHALRTELILMLSYPDAENRCFFPVTKGQALPFVCKTEKRTFNARPIYFLLLWIEDTKEFEHAAFVCQALNGKYAGKVFGTLPFGYRENTLRGELELGHVKNNTTPMSPWKLDQQFRVLSAETCEWMGVYRYLANTGVKNGYEIRDGSLHPLPGTKHPFTELDWTLRDDWSERNYCGPITNTRLVLMRTVDGEVHPIVKYKNTKRNEKKRKNQSPELPATMEKRAKPWIDEKEQRKEHNVVHDDVQETMRKLKGLWEVFPEPVKPEQVLGNHEEINQIIDRLCTAFELPSLRIVTGHRNYFPQPIYWREQAVAVFPDCTSTIATVLDLVSSHLYQTTSNRATCTASLMTLMPLLDLTREREKQTQ